jgi:hypothetical protein
VTAGDPVEPGTGERPDIFLDESIDPMTSETRYTFPGEEYMFTIERLPWGYNTTPYWIMSVPPELIASHSDIFTYDTIQLMRALLRMSGATATGVEKHFLVREKGLEVIDVAAIPGGGVVFVDRSRRMHLLDTLGRKPLALSCLPPVLQLDNAIGAFFDGAKVHVVGSAEIQKGKKSKFLTDMVSFDLNLVGSESVVWTEIHADVSFTAAVGGAETATLYLVRAGELYFADTTQKKVRATRVSQFDEEITLERLDIDREANRIYASDRDQGKLYVIDLDEDSPTPKLVVSDLGVPIDLQVDPGQPILVADAVGRRILEIDCSTGDRCGAPRLFASIPEFQRPVTVTRGSDGTVWVGDIDARALFAFDPGGNLIRVLDSYAGTGG